VIRVESRVSLFYLAVGLILAGAITGVSLGAWDYYGLPAAARPTHHHHALLRPSGRVGLSCGIAGTALFILNLTYLLRKRLTGVAWLGTLRSWMNWHILSGLAGAGFVLVHCAYLPQSSLGILALSGLAVVIVTGLVGRYIYAHVPRSFEGAELRREQLKGRVDEARAALESFGVEARLLSDHAPRHPTGEPKGLLRRLQGILVGDREVRADFRRLKAEVRGHRALKPLARRILPLARQFYRDRQWLARYGEVRSLMGAWRFLHRWIAILMLILVAFHVALAVRFGDLWIFGAGS